jgi:hypothetical protein
MIVQANAALNLFESIGRASAFADRLQCLVGEVHIFQVLEMIQNSLSDIPGLRATGAFGKLIEAFLDVGGESDREHAWASAIQV